MSRRSKGLRGPSLLEYWLARLWIHFGSFSFSGYETRVEENVPISSAEYSVLLACCTVSLRCHDLDGLKSRDVWTIVTREAMNKWEKGRKSEQRGPARSGPE